MVTYKKQTGVSSRLYMYRKKKSMPSRHAACGPVRRDPIYDGVWFWFSPVLY